MQLDVYCECCVVPRNGQSLWGKMFIQLRKQVKLLLSPPSRRPLMSLSHTYELTDWLLLHTQTSFESIFLPSADFMRALNANWHTRPSSSLQCVVIKNEIPSIIGSHLICWHFSLPLFQFFSMIVPAPTFHIPSTSASIMNHICRTFYMRYCSNALQSAAFEA